MGLVKSHNNGERMARHLVASSCNSSQVSHFL